MNGTELTKLHGRKLREARRKIGMVFQGFNLVDRLTVMENVQSGRLGYISTWAAIMRRYPRADIRRAYELMERVGIAHYADTHGFERDKRRDNAWRYRDYVIDSLNKDLPYDRFITDYRAFVETPGTGAVGTPGELVRDVVEGMYH